MVIVSYFWAFINDRTVGLNPYKGVQSNRTVSFSVFSVACISNFADHTF